VLPILSRNLRARRQPPQCLPQRVSHGSPGRCSIQLAKQCIQWSCLRMFTLAAHGRFRAEPMLLPWRPCAAGVSRCVASAMVKGASFNDKHALLQKMQMEMGSAMWLRNTTISKPTRQRRELLSLTHTETKTTLRLIKKCWLCHAAYTCVCVCVADSTC
jgi:hypothetical protein